jgi:hypothetical protein
MKDLQWFPPIPEPRVASAFRVIWSVAVGAGLGALSFARGHRTLAITAWVAALLLALGLNSPSLRKPILRTAHWLGAVIGRISTWALLWPFYVLVFGTVRLALSAARVDLLGLRLPSNKPSYWQPAAPERERAKYYHRLYTVEPAREESRPLGLALGILVLVLFLAGSSELILRSMGFGNPIVYRVDPRVGYYPAPNQDVHRYGGEIHINAFGMRSRDVTAAKPEGTFRILMLGDSTLYGGSYIDQSQMYATRLEGLLNQQRNALPNSPRQVEVLCMGVNAWGPQHELAYVEEFGLFQADLVMVMGPSADAYRPRYGIERLPFFAEGHRPLLAWQEFWDHLLWETNLRSSAPGEFRTGSQEAGDVMAKGVAAWAEIATLAHAHGANVDFEWLPSEEEARDGRISPSSERVLDALRPEMAKPGVSKSFPLRLFESNVGVPKLYHDGVHLDTYGHRIYALYLRNRVLQWPLGIASR